MQQLDQEIVEQMFEDFADRFDDLLVRSCMEVFPKEQDAEKALAFLREDEDSGDFVRRNNIKLGTAYETAKMNFVRAVFGRF